MKKVMCLAAILVLLAAVLCACELGSPASTGEPTTMEHVHEVNNRGNDENQHYDVCFCGEIMNV